MTEFAAVLSAKRCGADVTDNAGPLPVVQAVPSLIDSACVVLLNEGPLHSELQAVLLGGGLAGNAHWQQDDAGNRRCLLGQARLSESGRSEPTADLQSRQPFAHPQRPRHGLPFVGKAAPLQGHSSAPASIGAKGSTLWACPPSPCAKARCLCSCALCCGSHWQPYP